MRGSLNSRNSAGPLVLRLLPVLLFLAALSPGCGGSTKTAASRTSSAPTLKEFLATEEAGFRPALYDPPLETLMTDNRAYDDVHPAPGLLATAVAETIPGFRVQVFLTQDIDEASSVKAAVTKYLPDEWVYLVYDLPYYKVRVGNYAEKEAANESVKKLIGLGYADAWVVPERILKNPPPPVPALPDSSGK